jgi:peptide/nickel transport system substrate-binding protein
MANRSMDRRTFLKGTGGVLAAAATGDLLAACSSSSGSTSATTASNTAAIFGGTPKRGGHVNFGTWSEIDGFDPSINRWDQTGYAYAGTVYDPIAVYDSSGKIVPYLAQSITPNADFTQWAVTMRPNITFHDGAPLDGAAVATFAEKILSSPLTGYAFTPIKSVSVSDPMTVVFNIDQTWPHFGWTISPGSQLAYPPSPNFWKNPNRSMQPVGTGPFVFNNWVPNDHFSASRNPHYWRLGLPYLDSITFRPIPDTQSEENALKAGELDAMYLGSTMQQFDLQNDSSFFYFDDTHPSVSSYNPTIAFLMVNCAKPPLDDVRLRRALAAGLDTKKLIEVSFNGIGAPINGPFPPRSPNYTPNTGYPTYNPSQARQLVHQVASEKGPISINLGTVNNPTDVSILELVQAMWNQIGITSHIQQFEQTQFITNALNGNYDVYTYLLFGGLDFDAQYVWLSNANALPIGQTSLNFARFKDDQLQAALDQARMSNNPATITSAYQTVAKRLGQGCPYIWITATRAATASKLTVHNLAGGTTPNGDQIFRQGGLIFPSELWMS